MVRVSIVVVLQAGRLVRVCSNRKKLYTQLVDAGWHVDANNYWHLCRLLRNSERGVRCVDADGRAWQMRVMKVE